VWSQRIHDPARERSPNDPRRAGGDPLLKCGDNAELGIIDIMPRAGLCRCCGCNPRDSGALRLSRSA
jgi:hypothetical protein